MKAERRTMAPGTARKPASRKRFSPQPSNFEGTLSHHDALPGPPGITLMSLRRNESSTAFLSHWLTFHLPLASRSATRASPLSRSSSAPSTASRTSPLVAVEMPSRASKAALMVASRADKDIVASPGVFAAGGFFGIWRRGVKALSIVARAKARAHTAESIDLARRPALFAITPPWVMGPGFRQGDG